MDNRSFVQKVIITALYCIGLPGLAHAAAYASEAYSVSGLANAYAGSVTGAHDHTDMFTNPAALSQFNQTSLTIGAVYTNPDLHTHVDSTTIGGVPQSGTQDADPAHSSTLPTLYFSKPITSRLTFGLSYVSPYDLRSDYPTNSLARFHGVQTDIQSENLGANLSYKISDATSLGFGLQYERLRTTVGRNLPNSSLPAGQPYGLYKGSDNHYGFNLGILSQVTSQLRLGAAYQSEIKHRLEGSVTANSVFAYNGDVNLYSPASFTVGAAYQVNNQLEVVSDLRWTHWSTITQFLIERQPPNGSTPLAVLLPLRNSLLSSIGVNYKLNENWLLRGGLAYEKDAVTDDYRNVRFPVANRVWTTVGAKYQINPKTALNITYAHQAIKDASTNIPDVIGKTAGISAEFQQSINQLGVAMEWSWQ